MERIGGLAAGGCFARGCWFVNAWQSGSACLHRIKGARIKANLRAGHINLVKSELVELVELAAELGTTVYINHRTTPPTLAPHWVRPDGTRRGIGWRVEGEHARNLSEKRGLPSQFCPILLRCCNSAGSGRFPVISALFMLTLMH